MFPTFYGIPTIHGSQMASQGLAEVAAHTSFIHIHVTTTFVYPYTAPAGKALDSHEAMTFKQTSQYHWAKEKCNQSSFQG